MIKLSFLQNLQKKQLDRSGKASLHECSAFTIVEVAIVISIIGILSVIGYVSYSGIQERARDSQRKQDLSAIQKGVQLYYDEHGEYPHCGTNNSNDKSGCEATYLEDKLVPKYMDSIPSDPVNQAGNSILANGERTPNMRYMYARGYPPSTAVSSSTGYNYAHTGTNGTRKTYSLGGYMEADGCPDCSNNWNGGLINYIVGKKP